MQQTRLRSTNAIHSIPLSAYLLLTFGCAWLIWLPLLVAEYAKLLLPQPPIVLIVLGTFTPSLAALLLTWRYGGGTELRRLLGQAVARRVAPLWYGVAIFGPAIVMLLATGMYVLLGGKAPDYVPFGARWLVVPLNFILVFLIGGPLAGEFGWRAMSFRRLRRAFARCGPVSF
jgi:membrane protease YdiL (CAAX protease family)